MTSSSAWPRKGRWRDVVWQVVRWEVMRYLRNKQFIIGLFITPVIFAIFGALPTVIQRLDQPRAETYLVVDEIDGSPLLQAALAGSPIHVEVVTADASPDAAVLAGEADGFFVLDRQFVDTGVLTLFVEKQRQRPEALADALHELLRTLRMQEQSLEVDVLQYVSARPVIIPSVLNAPEDRPPLAGLPMSGVLAFLMFFLIMSSGSMLLQSAVQEKRDRMSEVVLSSIGADTLMTGKIIGHFLLGALQIGFWLLIGLPVAWFGLKLPVGDFIVPSLLPPLALFTLLGYMFYAAVFVGVGATMEDIQSASNTQGMVIMMPMLSFIVIGPVITNPEGMIARIATFFPVTTPIISMLRIGMEAMAGWEIAVAGVVMVISTWLVIKAASRLFRVGMLMYGKTATWREMWRWIRYPG